jgi:hypothetical protein
VINQLTFKQNNTMTLQPIIDQINEMSESNLIQLNNIYCRENSFGDEVWDNDDEFFNIFFPNSHEALQRCHFGNYKWNENYVKINDYGNVESFNYFETKDLVVSVETIAQWSYDNQSLCDYLDLDFSECDEDEEEKTFELVYELDDETYTIEIESIDEETAMEIFERDYTFSGLFSITEK